MLWDEEKKKGNQAFNAGQFDDAIAHYTTAINYGDSPQQDVLFSNRAACYLSLKQFEKALEDANLCIQWNPTNGKGHYRKYLALKELKRPLQAQDALRITARHVKGCDPELEVLRSQNMPTVDFRGPVEIRFSGTHGIGIYATRDIHAGEVLLRESPTVYVPDRNYALRRPGPPLTYAERMTEAVSQMMALRETNPTRFQQLMELYGGVTEGDDRMAAVYDFNAMRIMEVDFRVSEGNFKTGTALYVGASRLNHSCVPNSVQWFLDDGEKGVVEVRALEDITFDSEIFITYCPPYGPKEERCKKLKFECKCERCVDEGVEPSGMLFCARCNIELPLGQSSYLCPSCDFSRTQDDIAQYCKKIEETIDKYVAMVESSPTKETRATAFNGLDAIISSIGILGPYHHLRFRLYLEKMKLGIQFLPPRDLLSVATLATTAAEQVFSLCWPMKCGLHMFLAMCMCDDDQNDDEEVIRQIRSAFAVHMVAYSSSPRLFFNRYAPELRSMGIEDVDALTNIMSQESDVEK
eukprot:PhF_6_TR14267/c0_g1_i1/m.22946